MSRYTLNYVAVFMLGILFYFQDSRNPMENGWDLFSLTMFIANFMVIVLSREGDSK